MDAYFSDLRYICNTYTQVADRDIRLTSRKSNDSDKETIINDKQKKSVQLW